MCPRRGEQGHRGAACGPRARHTGGRPSEPRPILDWWRRSPPTQRPVPDEPTTTRTRSAARPRSSARLRHCRLQTRTARPRSPTPPPIARIPTTPASHRSNTPEAYGPCRAAAAPPSCSAGPVTVPDRPIEDDEAFRCCYLVVVGSDGSGACGSSRTAQGIFPNDDANTVEFCRKWQDATASGDDEKVLNVLEDPPSVLHDAAAEIIRAERSKDSTAASAAASQVFTWVEINCNPNAASPNASAADRRFAIPAQATTDQLLFCLASSRPQ